MRSLVGWSVVVAALWLVGCDPSSPPVAAVKVEPAELDLAYPEVVNLDFVWRDRQPIGSSEPRVFVHLLDGSGELVRTFDHVFPGDWGGGGETAYSVPLYQSAIAPALPAGRYTVSIGLYGPEGERWPLAVEGARGDEAYEVAEVAVSDVVGDLPIFHFSAEWLPAEFGRDRQILARRWIGEPGRLEVRNVTAPGALWLRLATPAEALEGHRLEVATADDGTDVEPRVLVTSDCDGSQVEIGDGEIQRLEIVVAADCGVDFEPNFAWVEVGADRRRAIAIEAIAWYRRQ